MQVICELPVGALADKTFLERQPDAFSGDIEPAIPHELTCVAVRVQQGIRLVHVYEPDTISKINAASL